MEFKRVFRGYDTQAVDKYLADFTDQNNKIHASQRERIVELLDENTVLRDRIAELQAKQNDISEALIVSRNAANMMEQQAKDYSDKALFQAKKFYATWQAYSQTIVASFTEDELAAFNGIQRRIERVISEYENKRTADAEPPLTESSAEQTENKANEESLNAEQVAAASTREDKKSERAAKLVNPIEKVEQAAAYAIDLKEILTSDESLEDLCADLGLIDSDDK